MSAAMTGFLLQYLSLGQLFVGAGLFLVAYSLLAYIFTNISHIAAPASAG